jgi:hypothetical protein
LEEITDSTPIRYQVQLILHQADNRCNEHGTVKLVTYQISDMVRGRMHCRARHQVTLPGMRA